MSNDKPTAERISLDCPLCTQTHDYDLTVVRMTIHALAGDDEQFDTEVTRLFTCPIENEEFEATLQFAESRRRRLVSVDASLANEDD